MESPAFLNARLPQNPHLGRFSSARLYAVRATDDSGIVLNAEYSVEPDDNCLALILESAGGEVPGSDRPRNADYTPALTLLLHRLRDRNACLLTAFVDSNSKEVRGLPEQQRTLIDGPVQLADHPGMKALRLELTSAQGRIGQRPGARKAGTGTKRIRLQLTVPGYGPGDAHRLASDLAAPTISDRHGAHADERSGQTGPAPEEERMRVALQPASLADAEVLRHYQDTIENPVVFEEHADLLEPGIKAQLERLFPQGAAPMWGVVPGKSDVNVNKVAKLRAGDFVLFYGSKKFYLAGTVALRWHNKPLAQRLWTDDGGTPAQTWEHMYALTDLRVIDVPIEEVRPVLGWSDSAFVMGFTIYDGEKAERLGELCNLDPSDLLLQPTLPSRSGPSTAAPGFTGATDREVISTQRREQRHFKRRLVEVGADRCALCGLQLPPAFLVAAHIKRRSECTAEERVDFDNVGMLACLLGCDSLYEHGYIAVDVGGKILISSEVAAVPAVKDHVLANLAGKSSDWWSADREKYFTWHRSHTFKRSL